LFRPVLVGLALYALLATVLNARRFFAGAIASSHGLRHIALAALVGMISPFFIVTSIVALRLLAGGGVRALAGPKRGSSARAQYPILESSSPQISTNPDEAECLDGWHALRTPYAGI
jgi:hypothetical protein